MENTLDLGVKLPFNNSEQNLPSGKTEMDEAVAAIQKYSIPQASPSMNSLTAFYEERKAKNAALEAQRNQTKGFAESVAFKDVVGAAYTEIGDGNYVPKYKEYYHGQDNESIAASRQSTLDRWGNGIAKNTGKALVYVLDGTIGTAVGVVEGIKEGSLEAAFNNDFSKWADEVNKTLDNNLPNYIRREEKNMSFLRSMGTANFWANDVLGGMAFVAGAVGSEAIWAAATGGSSLALASAKWGLKAGGKALVKTGIAAEKGALATATKKLLNGYTRTLATSSSTAVKALGASKTAANVVGALNNSRYILTSSGFEAGVEARQSLDESIANFEEATLISKHRVPTTEEFKEFMVDAVANANNVFAANVAIVGASNFMQFGKLAGLHKGVIAKGYNNIGKGINAKLFGLGIKTVDGTATAIKATRLQKIAGKTYKYLAKPIVEGFEEGSQGTISRMSQNILANKYDPTAMKEGYTAMDAFQDAFAESFGSREGFKEVGIGMLIGKLGSFAGGVRAGVSEVVKSGYNAQVTENEELAANYNKAFGGMTTATKAVIERSLLLNQQLASTKKSAEAKANGRNTEAEMFFHQASFAKMMAEHNAGMLDDSVESFSMIVGKMNDEALAEEMGIPIEEVANKKTELIEEYKADTQIFKKAVAAAEALQPQAPKSMKGRHYIEEVSSTFFQGVKAMDRLSGVSAAIEEATGESGFAQKLISFSQLSTEEKNKAKSLNGTLKKIKELDEEYQKIQEEYSVIIQKTPRTEENKSNNVKAEKNRNKAAEMLKKRDALETEVGELRSALENHPNNTNFSFGNLFSSEFAAPEELASMIDELDKLDGFIDNLSTKSKQSATALTNLIQDYKVSQEAFNNFHTAYEKITNPNFNFAAYKGVMKLFKNPAKYEKPTGKLTARQEQLEIEIEESKLDDYEAFNLRVLDDMSSQMYTGDFSEYELGEEISSDVWAEYLNDKTIPDEVKNSIAEKVFNAEALTNREQRLADYFKPEIDEKIKAIKKEKGDSIRKAKPKVTEKEDLPSTTEVIKDLIAQILGSKNYLEGMQVNDVSKEDVPSEEEYREINKLEAQKAKKPLSPKKEKRYTELKDKINAWGKVEGTFSGNYSLAGLYAQLFALEDMGDTTIEDAPLGVEVVEVMEAEELNSNSSSRHYNVLQTYDKTFFSKKGDKIRIHNKNIDGIIKEIQDILGITDDNIKRTKGKARITYFNAAGEEKIITLKEENGALVFEEETLNNINNDTNLRVAVPITNSRVPTNYYTVLKRVEKGGKVKLVALASDFENTDGVLSDNKELIQGLQEGAELEMSVDLTDEYNKKVIAEYKKDGDFEKLARNLKIRFVSEDNNLVGVLKAEHTDEQNTTPTSQSEFIKVKEIRRAAAKKVLEAKKGKIVELEDTVKVKKVYLGHPVLDIEETDGGAIINKNDFTPTTVERISDTGYISDGKLVTKSGKTNNVITTFISGILKNNNGRFTGKRVPVVIIDFYGKKVAYPISFKAGVVDSAVVNENVDSIINQDITDSEKALKLSELLYQNEFTKQEIESLKLIGENYKTKVTEIKKMLASKPHFASVGDLVTEGVDVDSLLIENAQIDVDLNGDVFHSPKVAIDLGEPSGEEFNDDFEEDGVDLPLEYEVVTEEDEDLDEIDEKPTPVVNKKSNVSKEKSQVKPDTTPTEQQTQTNEENIQPIIQEENAKPNELVEVKPNADTKAVEQSPKETAPVQKEDTVHASRTEKKNEQQEKSFTPSSQVTEVNIGDEVEISTYEGAEGKLVIVKGVITEANENFNTNGTKSYNSIVVIDENGKERTLNNFLKTAVLPSMIRGVRKNTHQENKQTVQKEEAVHESRTEGKIEQTKQAKAAEPFKKAFLNRVGKSEKEANSLFEEEKKKLEEAWQKSKELAALKEAEEKTNKVKATAKEKEEYIQAKAVEEEDRTEEQVEIVEEIENNREPVIGDITIENVSIKGINEKIDAIETYGVLNNPSNFNKVKEDMKANPKKAALAFQLMEWAKKAWGTEMAIEMELRPALHLPMFFYNDITSLKEYVSSQILEIEEENNRDIKYMAGLSKSVAARETKERLNEVIKGRNKQIEIYNEAYEIITGKQVEPSVEEVIEEALENSTKEEQEAVETVYQDNKELGETKEAFVAKEVVKVLKGEETTLSGDEKKVAKFLKYLRKLAKSLFIVALFSFTSNPIADFLGRNNIIIREKTQFVLDLTGVKTKLTENSFSEGQKLEMLSLIKTAEEKGHNYVTYQDYPSGNAGVKQKTKDSSEENIMEANDEMVIKRTLGQFTFEKVNNSYIISDSYDFNDNKGDKAFLEKIEDLKNTFNDTTVSSYGKIRKIATHFGSKEGEGSLNIIKLDDNVASYTKEVQKENNEQKVVNASITFNVNKTVIGKAKAEQNKKCN